MGSVEHESGLPRSALVTGAGGFAGRHLVRHLLESTAWNVAGLSRSGMGGAADARVLDLKGDITNPEDVAAALEVSRPDYVFHLAARTPPADDHDLIDTAVGGTTVLMEQVLAAVPDAAVLSAGSDAQYGPQEPGSLPTAEEAPMRPVHAYGRAKLRQEEVALSYAAAGLRVVCVRAFNHIGPGQSDRFVIPSIASQIARAEAGGPPVVEVGSTEDRRDFTDVRDVVRAYLQALIMSPSGGIYNIGSGVNHSIGEAVAILARMAMTKVEVRPVAGRVRRGEPSETCCDASRLRSLTGWAPAIDFETSLRDTLEHFRSVL
ncbi:MAG TPA: NAD-dependent epimerase/dehydratase family protein [Actinomycetota bacterium]|nr:NAD-dependent epimerase/dehydratase family protein [Actinomycetota bacterium]